MAETCVIKPLRTQRLKTGDRELLEPLEVCICGYRIVVNEGFQTDFSSIPTPFSWIVRWSRVDIAGAVHDMLYRGRCGAIFDTCDSANQTNLLNTLTIAEADRIWRAIARAGPHRAGLWQAWLLGLGIFAFSWPTWNRYRGERDRRVGGFAGALRFAVGFAVGLLLISGIGLGSCLVLELIRGLLRFLGLEL